MDSNSNAKLEEETEKILLSDNSTSSIKTECSSSSNKSNISEEEETLDKSSYIKEVYASNFKSELKKIKLLIKEGKYTYIGMDTEFPGIIYNLKNIDNDFYFKTMKLNIESSKLIQLGITLTNENGEFPEKYPYHTWQFNFKFDLEKDKYSEESINLLKNSGIDFENLKKNGIEHKTFVQALMKSSLVLNPEVKWISYQGSYDFGYLLNLLITDGFPEDEKNFIKTLKCYFPEHYDVKMLVKDNEKFFHGGLSKLIYTLGIERKGINHQAGSDAIATIEAYHKLLKKGIINIEKLKNVLYGIGIGKDNENTIKYIYNSKSCNVNNFNAINIINQKKGNNTVINKNMMYYHNQQQIQIMKNNNCNNYAKCYYPCYFINTYNLIKNNIYQNQMKISRGMMA